MKHLVYAIALAGLFFACGAPAEETTGSEKDTTTASEPVVVQEEVPKIENSFLLETGVVGIFHVGQPMPVLPDELSSRRALVNINDASGTPIEHVQYIVFNSLEDIAEITLEHDPAKHDEELKIQEVRVISNFYETNDGIKIGTSLTDLTTKYPDTKIRYDGLTHDIVAETPAFGNFHFVVDAATCTKALKGDKDISLTAKNFNEEAKVKTIKVY